MSRQTVTANDVSLTAHPDPSPECIKQAQSRIEGTWQMHQRYLRTVAETSASAISQSVIFHIKTLHPLQAHRMLQSMISHKQLIIHPLHKCNNLHNRESAEHGRMGIEESIAHDV